MLKTTSGKAVFPAEDGITISCCTSFRTRTPPAAEIRNPEDARREWDSGSRLASRFAELGRDDNNSSIDNRVRD
jgi:hypothetical protein